MLHLRTSLLRSLAPPLYSSAAPVATRSFVTVVKPLAASPPPACYNGLTRSQRSAAILGALRRRGYASEGGERRGDGDRTAFEAVGETVSAKAGDVATAARDAMRQAESGADSFSEEVRGAYSSARQTARERLGDAFETAGAYVNPRGGSGSRYGGDDRRSSSFASERGGDGARRAPIVEPSAEEARGNIYVGNLFFEVNEDTVKAEFERYGPVKSTRIIRDQRGLSKGFGYVVMERVEDAVEARNALHHQQLEGRRMTVQHSVPRVRQTTETPSFANPPSNTLFVGNMSYDMKDNDLNELFGDIENVKDIRVAIDRRTGTPRGFAHAEFTDVASAEAAVELLRGKEFYGRRLRIDYSSASAQSRFQKPRPDEM